METRNCQNCKKDFTIDADDFSFYEKMQVPAPTFCPLCRLQRRLAFRNERSFYKRGCELCGKKVISMFSLDRGLHVYCGECWWSDTWNPGDYNLDYDPNKNFFAQIVELMNKTPFMEKVTNYSTLINSDYINHAAECKNCYLIFTADYCENVYYGSMVVHAKDSADVLMCGENELVYNTIGGSGSSSSYFSKNCKQGINMWYSRGCYGCNDCFGCVNLRNKSYHIYNEPYSKEEYKKKLEEMELDKHSSHLKIREHIYDFWNKFPYRYVYGRMNQNAVGENVAESKNAKDCYNSRQLEDCAYCQFITFGPVKDSYDVTDWGNGIEHCIETTNTGEGVYGVKYSLMCWANLNNVEYSIFTIDCKNCFGCVNLRKKEYCIFNKQYTKDEYFKLREEIIADMEKNPYIDQKGRVFKYGEFFPYDISPFGYNESMAVQYFPLTKEKILDAGFQYLEPSKPEYTETIQLLDIPDSIKDIPEDFSKEVLKCNCGKYYRIVPGELSLLQRFQIPVPRECPDCRHQFRLSLINMPGLYDRNCDKCGMAVKSSYAPGRPEIIYCESCYQQEVI
jgi:Zn ribbon nucleic-acid-binding protein